MVTAMSHYALGFFFGAGHGSSNASGREEKNLEESGVSTRSIINARNLKFFLFEFVWTQKTETPIQC